MPSPLLVILGPTASGKTRLAVAAARLLSGEIISADSRQVYRGMDIGTGKDLSEYGEVPYHLIDVADPGDEFSLFSFLQEFSRAFTDITVRGRLPILAGGTGLYLDAVLSGYALPDAPENPELRRELALLSDGEVAERLRSVRPALHNTTDTLDRERMVRAVEIAESGGDPIPLPEFDATVVGIRWERELLRRRITKRLDERLRQGMVEEVAELLRRGVTFERLDAYGLEYRYVARFLRGELNRNDMFQKLNSAIHDFAKKQETWFRRMERKGISIVWVDGSLPMAELAPLVVSAFRTTHVS
jgi:tRNA dimethylallyltransferase